MCFDILRNYRYIFPDFLGIGLQFGNINPEIIMNAIVIFIQHVTKCYKK